ncbi:hypothetical protein E2C01_020388 [Portunus trituberculatus]|uniref:Uncharacterized protein n=1 Tax=Portunus trituberculatus TaxID=210409 RepID=A0A5B7DZR4_PORTR|nr:hypothetical protein [Portunus trituberculatus]
MKFKPTSSSSGPQPPNTANVNTASSPHRQQSLTCTTSPVQILNGYVSDKDQQDTTAPAGQRALLQGGKKANDLQHYINYYFDIFTP